MAPWKERPGLAIHCGDSINVLREIRDNSVQNIVTSPPYLAQRRYDADDTQIGMESTPEAYIENLTAIFDEVLRVLHPTGCMFLNLGDTYIDKRLQGLPWRVALTLVERGWVLRQEIIWHKNSIPMPVKDRCVTSHEHVFLLSKNPSYFFDYIAIREPCEDKEYRERGKFRPESSQNKHFQSDKVKGRIKANLHRQVGCSLRNKRSVWKIPTQPSKLRHFAMMPERLIEPCILAGTSEYGCCPDCMSPYARKTRSIRVATRPAIVSKIESEDPEVYGNRDPLRHVTDFETVGWIPTCKCGTSEKIPCTVLDPFFGAGTVGVVASKLGRSCIGIDISPNYCDIAWERLRQFPMEFSYGRLPSPVEAGEERQVAGDP